MTPSKYLLETARTDTRDYPSVKLRVSNEIVILHAIMGIITEGGELMDAYKKYAIYGKPLDAINLLEECGDLEWYMSLMLKELNSDYATIWQKNIDKLRARYPEKFTEYEALNRDLKEERKILEK